MSTGPIDAAAGAGSGPAPAESSASTESPAYSERLWVPAWWWLPVGLLVAMFWFACWLVIFDWWAHLPGLLAAVGSAAGLCWFGVLRVRVSQDGVSAGRGRLPLTAIERVEVLTPTRARVLRGGGANATARYVLRPYVNTAVRVELTDAAAPPPFWYVATRHPERLAATLEALGVPSATTQPRATAEHE